MIRCLLASALAIVLAATGAFAADAAGTPTANLLTGGTDQTFSRTDATGARTVLTDALGSTVALTDAAGVIQTSYTYEPYGKTTVTGTASTNAQRVRSLRLAVSSGEPARVDVAKYGAHHTFRHLTYER